MQNLFYTLEQYKNQARLLHSNMKEMKMACSYMQAMQLTAKSHGYKNWETLEKNVLNETLCINVNSSNEVTLDIKKSNNFWVTVNNISVCINANDEGVSVDLYPIEQEDCESIASTYAFYDEAENDENVSDLTHAETIKKIFLNNNPDSYLNQEYAVDCLMEECNGMFESRKSALEFLGVFSAKDVLDENNPRNTPEVLTGEKSTILPMVYTSGFKERIMANLQKPENKEQLDIFMKLQDEDVKIQIVGEVRLPTKK